MNEAVHDSRQAHGVQFEPVSRQEQLSALIDGQLQGEELRDALQWAAKAEGQAAWQLYHLVGDVLRSSDLAQPPAPDFIARLRGELAKEAPPHARVETVRPPVAVVAPQMKPAANASVFRWKMVAGFASLAAVAAVGWTSLSALQTSGPAAGAAQLARNAEPANAAAPVVAVADAQGGQVMIRDPRLDELLAAHKQFGSTSALQMPAGFLRNATFDSPSR